ncbi:bifunctional phosphopantothenoylcysteine decarboxylase/phosphopantothenate--cysteine ligase CoaBC [Oleiharenicola lentus]|uniref:bifunctional phosphopantothenoylcysteine decarboxylase/phosphopantothenate--cysteine ligase CoaBC n=1 Tax=Oleiharenicola lentus TaxID=2508720 RepID=UPI003F671456
MSGSKILFILTGSIACYKACDAISRLVQAGHTVRIVASEAALRFVGASTLEGLTGSPVHTDLWAAGQALDHIQLTRWADLVIVCPATAHTLNRLAAGAADDLIGALFLAHDRSKPWLMAPAMNPAMWSHPATQASVSKLTEWGLRFISVGTGRTACGESGEGRMAEPADVVAALEASVAKPTRKLRLLITSGGTSEPIDGVRVLTNTSTGRTGVRLAEHFLRCGHDVTLVRSTDSATANQSCRQETYLTFRDLEATLKTLLAAESFDAIIHASAVSDFSVASVELHGVPTARHHKLDSSAHPVIRLKPNSKMIDSLRGWSQHPEMKVVAFKLTTNASEKSASTAVADLFEHAPVDYVVQNDLSERQDAELFPAKIFRAPHTLVSRCATRTALAHALEQLLTTPAPLSTAP